MGFTRAQPRNRGTSFSFKNVHLSKKSKRAIRRVGYTLAGKACEHYEGAFGDPERTKLVTGKMRDLLDLDGKLPWVWEFIDISVTFAGCTRRHCDHLNGYRSGYDIAAIHSFPCQWNEKIYRVNMIYTTRYNVGAHMEKVRST